MEETEKTETGGGAFLACTFRLSDALFGIDTAVVGEVIRRGDMTAVHGAPEFIVGVLNLRGRIVTVIDLGRRMGLDPVVPGDGNRVIIADWRGEHVGLLVDEVSDVVTVESDAIAPPPANLKCADRRCFVGAYRSGERTIAVLDIDAVLSVGEKQGQVA